MLRLRKAGGSFIIVRPLAQRVVRPFHSVARIARSGLN
jgi:hypothetical protein